MCKLRGLAPTPTQLPQLQDNTPHYIHPIAVELSHHPDSTVHLHYLVILANSPNSSTLFRIYFSAAASNFLVYSAANLLYLADFPFLIHSLCFCLLRTFNSLFIKGLSCALIFMVCTGHSSSSLINSNCCSCSACSEGESLSSIHLKVSAVIH